MISQSIIDQVNDRVDIVDIIREVIDLKKSGNSYKACCPFHNERTPSFVVSPARNTWHCFGGCQEGGGAIKFVMKYHNLSFPEAVEYIAERVGVTITEEDRIDSIKDKEASRHREALLIVNDEVQRYFVECFAGDTAECKAARAYANKRWDKRFCKEIGIGYAPKGWQGLINYANRVGISIQSLKELSLICQSEKDGKLYDFFRERITIPIRNKYGRIIGWTARDVSGDPGTAKYFNSRNSLLYDKGNSIFGVDIATKAASKLNKFYIVEGAPDVLRLQSIGVNNAVAPLGLEWNEKQLNQLKRYSENLCFIPDSDPPKIGERYGAGIKGVIKNATLAMSLGFYVTVKEIPQSNVKSDPDSHITSTAILNGIEETDFIPWLAVKTLIGATQESEKAKAIDQISGLLAGIEDKSRLTVYLNSLAKMSVPKTIWEGAVNRARNLRAMSRLKGTKRNADLDLLDKYGFQEQDNHYIAIGKEGKTVAWSNFTMRPLFHIKDSMMPLRLFELRNVNKQTEIVELRQEDLVSITKFKQKVEGLGNYVWLAKEEQLTKLKMYLYESTETAVQIIQLGWQRQGFFAFGNGVFTSEWHPVDELGIVRLPDIGNFYLPAFSKIYTEDTQFYQFERSFVHNNYNAVSLRDYCQRLITVFGDNAKVGIGFLLASLFRDVVVSITKSFPILNLFGPKGSGKSELGHSLMSFFIIENTPPNIQNSTVPALADTVAQCANALVHLDEFKNDIDILKREFLKGLWDGTGRNRMNMDRDKKREVTKVSCGVIVSGQEMATADIALFTRFIFLSYAKSEFTREAKSQFEALLNIRKKGCSHLTLQILKYRKRFEGEFKENYSGCLLDLVDRLDDAGIEDRILRNWLIPLAAFRTLEGVLDMPFTYKDLLEVSVAGIRRQNSEVKQNNELADFWHYVAFLQQDGKAFLGSDFRIKHEHELDCKGLSRMIFPADKQILYLRFNRISHLFETGGKGSNVPHLPIGSLLYYLENSTAYLGKKNMRFDMLNNGMLQFEVKTDKDGRQVRYKRTSSDLAMCFDYNALKETFGINLETQMTNIDDE